MTEEVKIKKKYERDIISEKIHQKLCHHHKNVAWLETKMVDWGFDKAFRKTTIPERETISEKLDELLSEREAPSRKRRKFQNKL